MAVADCSEAGHREPSQEQRLQVLYQVMCQFTAMPAKSPGLAGFPVGSGSPGEEAQAHSSHSLNLRPVGAQLGLRIPKLTPRPSETWVSLCMNSSSFPLSSL